MQVMSILYYVIISLIVMCGDGSGHNTGDFRRNSQVVHRKYVVYVFSCIHCNVYFMCITVGITELTTDWNH